MRAKKEGLETLDHFTRYERMQLSLSYVRLCHSGPQASLAACSSVCLVIVQESSKRRQIQTVLNACTKRFERSPRVSCNLIGSTQFRVEPKQSGPKFLDPLFPVLSRKSICAGEIRGASPLDYMTIVTRPYTNLAHHSSMKRGVAFDTIVTTKLIKGLTQDNNGMYGQKYYTIITLFQLATTSCQQIAWYWCFQCQ